MSNTKKFSLLLIGAVVIGSIFVYYRYAKVALQSTEENMVVPAANTRSAVITYDAYEGKMDTLRFVVTLDSTGAIEMIQTLDAATGEVIQPIGECSVERQEALGAQVDRQGG